MSTDPILTAIFEDIQKELVYQESKFGTDRVHEPALWAVVLGEEYGEVCKAVLEHDGNGYIAELVDVAAVCVSAIRSALLERGGKPVTRTCATSTLNLTNQAHKSAKYRVPIDSTLYRALVAAGIVDE